MMETFTEKNKKKIFSFFFWFVRCSVRYGNPSGKFAYVLGAADFIASTNLSPNFIKAKNGSIFVSIAPYVCNDDRNDR